VLHCLSTVYKPRNQALLVEKQQNRSFSRHGKHVQNYFKADSLTSTDGIGGNLDEKQARTTKFLVPSSNKPNPKNVVAKKQP